MTDTTANLALPFIAAAQAQKHVTHNEALLLLDALVQLAVLDKDLAAPPASPQEGARWIVAAGASGAWAGQAGKIAAWQDGAWRFLSPRPGFVAFVLDEAAFYFWNGSAWTALAAAITALQNLALLGVGTSADATNPFAAKLNNVLWSARYAAEGGDGNLRYKLNKESAGNTLSLLFQTNWSGRAEIGLAGDDDFRVKVSQDGTLFKTAMIAKNADGRVTFPCGITHPDSGQPVALLLPAPVKEVWRIDAARSSTPRTYTIGSVSGSTISLTEAKVGEIFTDGMRNVAMVRIWNISKSPAEAAWVNWNNSATQLSVSNAAHIATWAAGETIRLGDPNPTGTNALNMVAIDISNYLFNNFGSVFKQKGLQIAALAQGTGSDVGLDVSGSGAVGTAFGINSLSNGGTNSAPITVFTDQSSPISNSNLLFVRESVRSATALNIVFLRVVGVYV